MPAAGRSGASRADGAGEDASLVPHDRRWFAEEESLQEIGAVLPHPRQLRFYLDSFHDRADPHAVADLEELAGDQLGLDDGSVPLDAPQQGLAGEYAVYVLRVHDGVEEADEPPFGQLIEQPAGPREHVEGVERRHPGE